MYNPCIFKAFLDLTALNQLESKEVMLRANVQEREKAPDEDLDLLVDCPTYEPKETYLRIKVKVDKTLVPKVTEYQIQTKDLIPKKRSNQRYSKKDQVMQVFKEQLKEEIMLLTKEYYQMYRKELEHEELEKKRSLQLGTNKRLSMRKNEFIERFKKSAQFNALKKRLSLHIVDISNACFKMKSDLNGITRTSYDKIFSDLYKVMLKCAKEAMIEQLDYSKDESESKIINAKDHMETKVYRIVKATTNDNKKQRFLQLIEEYENNGLSTMTINRAKQLVDEGNTEVISRYCSLLLQSSQFLKAEDYLGMMIRKTGGNEESLLIMTLLFLNKGKKKEALVVLMNLLKLNPESVIYNILMSHVYTLMEQELQAARSLSIAKRICMRKFSKINYSKSEMMPDQGIGSKPEPLSETEHDSMYIETAMTVIKLNFSNIAKIFYDRIGNKEAIDAKLVEIELVIRDGDVVKAAKLLKQLSKIFEDDKKLLELYAQNQMQLQRYKTAEKLLLKLITLRGNMGVTLTTLGYLKIKRRKYEEARITFYRAVQLNKSSIMAWIGLGKACVLLKQYNDALSALKYANILDPLNPEVWLHIVEVSLRDRTKRAQTVFALREMIKLKFLEFSDLFLLINLIKELYDSKFPDYSLLLLSKLSKEVQNSEVELENRSKIWIQIALGFERVAEVDQAKWALGNYELENDEVEQEMKEIALGLKERIMAANKTQEGS